MSPTPEEIVDELKWKEEWTLFEACSAVFVWELTKWWPNVNKGPGSRFAKEYEAPELVRRGKWWYVQWREGDKTRRKSLKTTDKDKAELHLPSETARIKRELTQKIFREQGWASFRNRIENHPQYFEFMLKVAEAVEAGDLKAITRDDSSRGALRFDPLIFLTWASRDMPIHPRFREHFKLQEPDTSPASVLERLTVLQSRICEELGEELQPGQGMKGAKLTDWLNRQGVKIGLKQVKRALSVLKGFGLTTNIRNRGYFLTAKGEKLVRRK